MLGSLFNKTDKSTKITLLFWVMTFVLILLVLFYPFNKDNGLIVQIFSSFQDDILFWSVMTIIFISYAVLCIYLIICKVGKAVRKDKDKTAFKVRDYCFHPQIITNITLNSEESSLLNRLVDSDDKSWQIAVALVLKDFIEERNVAICKDGLEMYIPSYTNIREDIYSSLKSLVYVMSLLTKYHNDKYYHPALICDVIASYVPR